jgi:hypothetical protein
VTVEVPWRRNLKRRSKRLRITAIRGKTRCVLLHFDSSKRCVCPLYKFLYAFKFVKLFLKHPVYTYFLVIGICYSDVVLIIWFNEWIINFTLVGFVVIFLQYLKFFPHHAATLWVVWLLAVVHRTVRNSKFSNVMQYCLYFEGRGRANNSNFNMAN